MTRLLAARRSIFRGWWVVSGAMLVQGLHAALFFGAFGVYAPFWMADFGWSRTTVSLIHSLQRTESGLLGPVNGWLINRYGPQRLILIGLVLMGGSMVALGFTTSFATFLATFLVMAIGASFSGILSLMTIIVNWFERRRATAMALVGLGMSIGGLTGPLLAWLIVVYGWRGVSVASGVLLLAVTLPLGKLLISEPELVGLTPDGLKPRSRARRGTASKHEEHQEDQNPEGNEGRKSTRQVLRSRAFWLMSVGHSNALAIVSAVGVHYVIFAQEAVGMSVTTGAALLMVMTLFSMVGQTAGGVLGDRLDKRWVAGSGMLLHTSAMVLLTFLPNQFGVVAAAVLHGLGWGVRGPLMSALRADYFGREAFATVMGFSSLIVTVGSVAGPLLVGLLADSAAGYTAGFLVLSLVGLSGAVAFFVLEAPPQRVSVVTET